jgi:uncharacterized protein (TIRG00374 family)
VTDQHEVEFRRVDVDEDLQQAQPSTEAPSRLHRAIGALARIPTPAIFIGSMVLAFVVLWWQGALSDFVNLFRDADWSLLAIAAPIYIASLWLLCYRWHYLVRMAHGSSYLPRAAEAFLTSVVINYATPLHLAAPSRALLTKRALGLSVAETGIIAVWEIGADVIVLGAGSILWLLIADGAVDTLRREAGLGMLDIALIALGGCVLFWLVVLVLSRRERWRVKIVGAGRTLALAPRERPLEALVSLAVSVVYWTLQGVVLAVVISALGVSASFELTLGVTSMPILIGMFGPLPGGAGLREGLMYGVAELSNAPGGTILAAAIVYRLALFGAIPILYLFVRAWLGLRSRSEQTAAPVNG